MATLAVGATLREERLKLGLSLEDIALPTRISTRFLKAIEEEAFDRLPGILFTRNFVRQYALFVKLDPAPLLAHLPSAEPESPAPAESSHFAISPRDSGRPSALSSLLWVALAIGASAGAWWYFERPSANSEKMPSPVVAHSVPAVTGQTAVRDSPEKSKMQPVEPASNAPGHALEVVLKAKEASWVRITADGEPAFTGILNPNDSRKIAADALVKVTTGNAGGLEISLNGKSLDPLGPSGQVKTVRLTPEGLQPSPKIFPSAPL